METINFTAGGSESITFTAVDATESITVVLNEHARGPAGTGGTGSGNTNLTFTRTSTTVTVLSDSGTDAILPAATTTLAGVMLATDKAKLDAVVGVNTGNNATNSQYSGLAASKQDTLVSGTNIKTINGASVLGSGNIVVSAEVTPTDLGSITTLVPGSFYYHASLASRTFDFSASLTNGQGIRLEFLCAAEITLTFPISYREADSGFFTSVTFPAGTHSIRWQKIGTIQKVYDTAWVESAADTTAPTLSSATIAANGTTLTLVFSEAVSAGAGGTGGFDVDGTVSNNAATYVSGTGTNTIIFSLASTVMSGETPNLDYTQPTNGWQDSSGNDLASITSASITNNSTQTADTTAPTLSSATIGTNGTTLTLVFSETVTVGGGGNGGFNVDASTGGTNVTATYASGSGTTTLVYTLGTTILSGETCDLDYTQPGNGIEDTAGNDLATITSASVTNNSTQSGSSTSYANAGGTGDRTASITVTSGVILITGSGANSDFVNGNTADMGRYFGINSNSGGFISFDFGSSKVIDEAKFYQSTSATHGDWKWQGSVSDGTTWVDIGSSFTLGGAATQTITTLAGNTTAYRYYRILGVTGTTSDAPYLQEFEFKIS